MNKKLNILIPVIYFILCIIISFLRVPFWDEARAWLISANSNVIDFLDLMKLECHLFIWYLIIFPFAKLNILYPYSIYIINAFIASGAIFVLWKKSPFNILEKLLITFSTPFLFLWGSVARCYSIGILFLFLALSYYKIRFKKPFIYISFLSLSMNTSIMAFIGSFFLSLIFLFENIGKKNFIKLLIIFSVSLFVVIFQIYSPDPDYLKQMPEMAFLRDFMSYLLIPVFFIKQYPIQSILMSLLRCAVIIQTLIFIVFTFKNNKKILFFISASYFSMVILFTFFYSGNFWHYFFFYLYYISAYWLIRKEKRPQKAMDICFIVILFLSCFKGSMFIDSKLTTVNNSTSKYIAKEIINNPIYKNKKLFCLDPWSDIAPSSLPYLKQIPIYDKDGDERKSAKSMKKQIDFNLNFFNPDEFYKYVDDNSILLTTTAFLNHEENNPARKKDEKTGIIEFKGKYKTVSFIPLDTKEDICLWSYLIKVK